MTNGSSKERSNVRGGAPAHRTPTAQRLVYLVSTRAISARLLVLFVGSRTPTHGDLRSQKTLPDGDHGIAARHPGDVGIAQDPAVVFVEDFEENALETMAKRWEDVGNRDNMSFASDSPPGSGGEHSLVMRRPKGSRSSGAGLYRRIQNPNGGWGYDQLFARFYVKFAPDCGAIHHFGTTLGGNWPATPWPMVSAGKPPDGSKSFWTGIEPYGQSWTWDYYTYWCEMRGSPPHGQTWGNSFIRDPKLAIERGKWICVELMMKVNDPGEANGEQALWLDGKLISHLGKGFPRGRWIWDKFEPGQGGAGVRWNAEKGGREDFDVPDGGAPFEGFRWRAAPELTVNYLWLYIYSGSPDPSITVAFDDVVVAKNYIGPIKSR
jgi:hypothetical protein